MTRARIPKSEFKERVKKIQERMRMLGVDACFVYGDEYLRDNLRYLTNYWPIFERSMAFVPSEDEPVLLVAPEGEAIAKEMSPWKDIRNVKDLQCVTVPEEISYPHAKFIRFQALLTEFYPGKKINKIGIVSPDAIPTALYSRLEHIFEGIEIISLDRVLIDLRLIKSVNEIDCLREAGRIADLGYEALMDAVIPGKTELQAVAAGECKTREEGAEDIAFVTFGSGDRADRIVPRPTAKVVREGEMVITALAVQYEGYIATVEFPLVVGSKPSKEQKRVIDTLIVAEGKALKMLAPGIEMREFVKAVKSHYEVEGFGKYAVYTPLHGIGCAEAELPYPNEYSEMDFQRGMTVNADIHLIGTPAGSNRIEEGFVITSTGVEPLSKLVRNLCESWMSRR